MIMRSTRFMLLAWILLAGTPAGAAYTYQYQFSGGSFASAVAVDGSGDVFVADSGYVSFSPLTYYSRIDEFTSTGSLIRTFGSYGTGNGQLSNVATGVAVDSSGNVFVADGGNNRIDEFTSTGSFVRSFSSLGSGGGQLSDPSGVAVDSSGNVFVAGASNYDLLEEFTNTGSFVRSFSS